MEFKLQKALVFRTWIMPVLIIVILGLTVTTASAETYRWKDKEGKVHYGASVPAEYAEQPYDILNNSGIVIEHVEDTTLPMEAIEQEKEKKKSRQPLIPEEERRIQSDRLLVVQYNSEEDIIKALNMEVSQLDYDSTIIEQSFDSTNKAIRDRIRLLGDQQRSNQPVSEEQKKEIASLYARRSKDTHRREALAEREGRIRARFEKDLERYRFLKSGGKEPNTEQADQG